MDRCYDGCQFRDVKSQADSQGPFVESAPIKILRIITRLNIGGPARQAIALSTRLSLPNDQAVLVTGRTGPDEGDLGALAEASGVRRVVIPALRREIHPWHDARAFWALLRIIRRERPDIIHTHMAKAGTLGRLAGLVCHLLHPGYRPVLIHTFHGHVFHGYFGRLTSRFFIAIERWLAARTDCLLAVSETIRSELLRYRIGHPERMRVIPVGLDLEPVLALTSPSTAAASVFRVGMVGRLAPVKNPELFLRVLAHLQHKDLALQIHGFLIGDGELRASLHRMVTRLGVEDRVTFLGWQSDLADVYQHLDGVCLTSLNEGTPLALIEAMAAARPAIATDVGGVRDLLGPPSGSPLPGCFLQLERGLVVRSGDVEGLAEALRFLATRPDVREQLGQAGRHYVQSRFTNERLVGDLEELYASLMASRREPMSPAVAVMTDNVKAGACT